jgi:hypothetical protein
VKTLVMGSSKKSAMAADGTNTEFWEDLWGTKARSTHLVMLVYILNRFGHDLVAVIQTIYFKLPL